MKISLVPNLEKFVADKIKSGDYQDSSEVIRDSLRRWKEREEAGALEREWLEREIQEGFDSPDSPLTKTFWKDLKKELQGETDRLQKTLAGHYELEVRKPDTKFRGTHTIEVEVPSQRRATVLARSTYVDKD